MTNDAAKALLEILNTAYVISVKNNQKLMALEFAMKDEAPEMWKRYEKVLQRAPENSSGMPQGLFEALQGGLLP